MKGTVKIEILDEVNVQIRGLSDDDLNNLWEKFGIYDKSFRHKPQYKLGLWDGKKRFFFKNGKTFFNLLPDIVPMLSNMGYNLNLIDNRKKYDLTIPPIDKHYLANRGIKLDGEPLILGEHQVRCVNALTKNSGELIEAGTGAGKSICTAILCLLYEDYFSFKSIVIVPTTDLIKQTHADLVAMGVDAGRFNADYKEINHTHLVSTWQSLQKVPHLIQQYQVVIVDECHGVTGKTLREILNTHAANCVVKMGLTGTLPEHPIDMMNVRITLGNVVETVEAHELIESGWLAELKLYQYELIEDLRTEFTDYCHTYPEKTNEITYEDFKRTCFHDYASEKSYLQKRKERITFIANLISMTRREKKSNTLVLVPNVAFGKKIAKEIEGSIFFYGQDSGAIRKEIYDSFKDHDDLIAITTFKLASTGLNIKRIYNLFLIDPNKSFVEIIQSIGRGLRKDVDKNSVNVYDIHSDLTFSKRHSKERLKHYKKKQYTCKRNKIDYLRYTKNI